MLIYDLKGARVNMEYWGTQAVMGFFYKDFPSITPKPSFTEIYGWKSDKKFDFKSYIVKPCQKPWIYQVLQIQWFSDTMSKRFAVKRENLIS